jgi:D-alanyl-lipoteichoic acid acyltransferase DltB (MBOAT superfamily)
MVVARQDFGQALFLILKGFIKKAILADYLAQYGDIVFEHPAGYSGFENLIAMYSYTLQIYCDFSGYSDMAIGLALLLGYRLPENFRSPYQSLSITEFWRRWHISLSFWLRDYIYIALGGNRKGLQRQYLFLMITMLVGGWWHGASWKFVFWGGMHGLALVLHKLWLSWKAEQAGKAWFEAIPTWLSKPLAWLLTFHFVAVLWLYFRAKDFQTASVMLWQMVSDWNLAMLPAFWAVRPLVLVMLAVGLLLHFTKAKDKMAAAVYFGGIPLWAKALVFLGLIQLSLQLRGAAVAPFIYFQF